MREYLMTISIGPVQDFIAAARRLRDLWFGSYLLSELSKKAASSLAGQGAELIFPYPNNQQNDLVPGSEMKAPNKLLAKVRTEDPAGLFIAVKQEILDFWLKQLAWDTVKHDQQRINTDLFNEQVADFLEIYGAWTVLDGDYAAARKDADRLLSCRKTLREFEQTAPPQPGKGGLPKSSLDGVRESVFRDDLRMAAGRKRGLKENEELDAVGWVKRYGNRLGPEKTLPVFETLSDLAADPFLRGLAGKANAQARLEDLTSRIKECRTLKINKVADREHRRPMDNLAPRILYPSSFHRELTEPDKDLSDHEIKDLLKSVREVHRAAEDSPLPYAAILLADGDNMGQALGMVREYQAHRTFSAELDLFARDCETLVSGYYGSLIYSGGDDVLAFVPLDQAVACAKSLAVAFEKRMRQALPDASARPTLSVGLAIVHHLKPLNLCLDLARSAERLAKAHPGKNALAVILDKRSGAPIRIVGGWTAGLADRMAQWTELHFQNLIPDKFGYQLRVLAREFGDEKALRWTADGAPDSLLAFEFLRVLQRKRGESGTKELRNAELQAITNAARDLNTMESLANELILTRIFAEAQLQARGKHATH